MEQVALVASGIQGYVAHGLKVGLGKFCYCSTHAIYVHRLSDYMLERVIAGHGKEITAFCLANINGVGKIITASNDKQIKIWDLQNGTENKKIDIKDYHVCDLDWSPTHPDIIFIAGKTGFKYYSLEKEHIVNVVLPISNSSVEHVKVNPKETDKIFIGFENGSHIIFSFSQQKSISCVKLEGRRITDFQWDPLSSDFLLVSYGDRVKMYDIYYTQKIQDSQEKSIASFEKVSGGISSVQFIDEEPGNFITSDARSGVLRFWNVSQTAVKSIVKLDRQSGIKELKYVPTAKLLLIAFLDGAVAVFNTKTQKIDFHTPGGHTETVFDCEFCKTDANIFATVSYDGYIKIWNFQTMECIQEFKENAVIYCVTWHPEKKIIAAGLEDGSVCIYDIFSRCAPIKAKYHSGHVYKLSWNMHDTSLLASASKDGTLCIFKDDGQLIKTIKHPASIFGCEWSPHDRDVIATGCFDYNVRVFNIASSTDGTATLLKGHSAEVYNVKWNPILPNVLLSTSNDRTVRVWNSATGDSRELKGHTNKVRAITWSPEISYLAFSGSWDGTIRVWDTRTGQCLQIVSDHQIDVYSFDIHPHRPFLMASCSRDTTIRFWSYASFVEKLMLQAFQSKSLTECIAPSTPSSFDVIDTTRTFLSGSYSRFIQAKIKNDADNFNRLHLISELFSQSPLTQDFWQVFMASKGIKSNNKTSSIDVAHSTEVSPILKSQLEEIATFMKSTFGRVRGKKKLEALNEISSLYLKLGMLQEYCQTLIDIDEWEMALSIAPAVSLDYWRSLVSKYANHLSSNDKEKAVPYFIAAGEIDKAVNFCTYRNNFEDAFVLASRKRDKGFSNEIAIGCTSKAISEYEDPKKQLLSIAGLRASRYMKEGNPIKAAISLLAVDDYSTAIKFLQNSNLVFLAFSIASLTDSPAIDTICLELVQKSLKCKDVTLASEFASKISQKEILIPVLASAELSEEEINLLYVRSGFQQFSFYDSNHSGDIKSSVLARKYSIAAEKAVELLSEEFAKPTWNWIEISSVTNMLNAVKLNDFDNNLKFKVLFYVNFVAGQQALWKGYQTAYRHLANARECIARISASEFVIDPEYVNYLWLESCALLGKEEALLQIERLSDSIKSAQFVQAVKNLKQRIELNTQPNTENFFGVLGFSLPTSKINGSIPISIVSKKACQYPPLLLEDEKSCMSYSEALMWKMFCSFSPLNNGTKLKI